MIKFINYTNEDFERQFEPDIRKYYQEVRKLLPNLPNAIQIYFMSDGFTYGMLTGGYAYSPEIISIAIDSKSEDIDELRANLRSTVFHEAYHVIHNYTGQTGPFSLLECALQEGSATVFEIQYANSKSINLYGNYRQHSISQLDEWLNTIKAEGYSKDMNKEAHASIAFYDKSDNVRWKLYKTGTWLVEKYITKTGKDIKDFTNGDIKLIINSIS